MASLNANDHVLTLYDDNHNVALSLNSNTISKLTIAVCATQSNNFSEDTYLGLIRHCSALSPNGRWYAVAAQRNLVVWCTGNWEQKCVTTMNRSASRITFTPSNDKILVADKTGDVYLFLLEDDYNSKNVLLLGHVSMLLDILMTPDEKFIITCDRDEKIRVTCYPNTHNIEKFCLGHSAFVTKILLIDNCTLLSASGDGTLKFWHYVKGDCLKSYCVQDDVDDCSHHCIITNMTIYSTKPELIICVSVFKHKGLLVYTCKREADYELKLVQKIDCCEPLDFVSHESVLWILKYSPSCLLNALSWDMSAQKYSEIIPSKVKQACCIINENFTSFVDSSVNLSVLHKKFDLKEKSVAKKVKLK